MRLLSKMFLIKHIYLFVSVIKPPVGFAYYSAIERITVYSIPSELVINIDSLAVLSNTHSHAGKKG